jgi:hypothetical protein
MGLDKKVEDCNEAIQDLENDDKEQPKKPSLIHHIFSIFLQRLGMKS